MITMNEAGAEIASLSPALERTDQAHALEWGEDLCPVCGYAELGEPAYDAYGCASFEICPCCGVEFGYDDATRSHAELRAAWIQRGMLWWSQDKAPPPNWDPNFQLRVVNFPSK